jgi:hypothetical protein
MKGRMYQIAGVLFLLALIYDLFLWGGLARVPNMGPAMQNVAARELSLAGLYLPLGNRLVELGGVAESAAAFAESRFAELEARVMSNPAAAMDIVLSGMSTGVSIGYYGAPVLLVLFLLLWWRRPRIVQSALRR